MSTNLDYDLVNDINQSLQYDLDLILPIRFVKSNVAIASAVTSYARIEMIKYKTLPNVILYYTDTDSIFINKELPQELVGNELGQMKDELKGAWIKEGYFFGVKKYGYLDSNNKVHSIFSGVERDTLTWNDIIDINNGKSIIKNNKPRFFKNFNNLNINIHNNDLLTIKFNPKKQLINNKYIPIHLNNKFLTKFNYFNKLITFKIMKLIKKYCKIKKFSVMVTHL